MSVWSVVVDSHKFLWKIAGMKSNVYISKSFIVLVVRKVRGLTCYFNCSTSLAFLCSMFEGLVPLQGL